MAENIRIQRKPGAEIQSEKDISYTLSHRTTEVKGLVIAVDNELAGTPKQNRNVLKEWVDNKQEYTNKITRISKFGHILILPCFLATLRFKQKSIRL